MSQNLFDVIIIGAGAAGLMCGAEAGKRGRNVLILEHAEKPGKKILISGGGRCNFTNLYISPDKYISENPHFCKSALSRYTQYDFISLVSDHGIEYHEKTLGQLFCNGKSVEILNMLFSECRKGSVQIKTNISVTGIEFDQEFIIRCGEATFRASKLVVASGGKSIPKMGATSFGYRTARQFGHKIVEPKPGLVPLTFDGELKELCGRLAGVSVFSRVSTQKISFEENILFTHRGLSGPAILQISNYLSQGEGFMLNLLPGSDPERELSGLRNSGEIMETGTYLSAGLAKRVVTELLTINKRIKNLSDREIKAVSDIFTAWNLKMYGTEGFDKAEVTLGGVDTKEISSKSFESVIRPGLFFIGEVLDVTGWLGGYNFQWAWSSGYCCAQYL